ncbi:hypothetical protein GCM10029992_47930 [Glycomyces albus]
MTTEWSGWRKSSRSQGNGGACVEVRWRKSSRSSSQGDGDCVEVRYDGSEFQVRDSKLGEGSPIFDLSAEDFAALRHVA